MKFGYKKVHACVKWIFRANSKNFLQLNFLLEKWKSGLYVKFMNFVTNAMVFCVFHQALDYIRCVVESHLLFFRNCKNELNLPSAMKKWKLKVKKLSDKQIQHQHILVWLKGFQRSFHQVLWKSFEQSEYIFDKMIVKFWLTSK